MHSRGRPAIASHVGVPSLAKPRAASLSANVRRQVVPIPAVAEEIIAAAKDALRLSPAEFPGDQPLNKISGQPEWHSFEHGCWKLGEFIRQKLLKAPRLREDRRLVGAILDVIDQRNLRRGRQSFVMLLGSVKAAHVAPRIARWAGDPDIAGHVVDTLLKMRVPGYADVVRPHVSSKYTWIRRKAKTYMERYAA
jgi:hypothetical protein